ARRVEAAKNVEQRRLAAAGGSEQDDELAGRQRQIDAAERMHLDVAAAVDLGQGTATQGGRAFGRRCDHSSASGARPRAAATTLAEPPQIVPRRATLFPCEGLPRNLSA